MQRVVLLLIGLAMVATPLAQASPPISKGQLQSMFDSMRRDAPWSPFLAIFKKRALGADLDSLRRAIDEGLDLTARNGA